MMALSACCFLCTYCEHEHEIKRSYLKHLPLHTICQACEREINVSNKMIYETEIKAGFEDGK